MGVQINKLPGWIYREINFAAITSPTWSLPIRPSNSFDWILERLQARYFSDAAAPSVFGSPELAIEMPQQNRNLTEIPIKIPLFLNPGLFDRTAGTTRPKEYFFKSTRLDWPFKALENFIIHVENHVNTGVLGLLFIGHYILKNA
jgi:hypothetical protein